MRLFLLVLVLCVTPAFAGLVTNGTFDSNCANWNYGGFASFCDTSSGNPAPALVLNDGEGPVPQATQSIAGLVNGFLYEITLDAKSLFNCCNHPSTPAAGVGIDGKQFEFLVTNGQPWKTYTFGFTYDGGSNVLVLSAQRNGTDSDAEFDNVDINLKQGAVTPEPGAATPEPGTLLMLGGGVAALLAFRRRTA